MHLTKATTITLFSSTFKKVKKERRSHADPDTRRPLAAPYQYLGNAHEHAAICNISAVFELKSVEFSSYSCAKVAPRFSHPAWCTVVIWTWENQHASETGTPTNLFRCGTGSVCKADSSPVVVNTGTSSKMSLSVGQTVHLWW